MEILIKALQLILALVILVTVHEFGHYIFARIFKVRVNRFYLFFNPWFSLLRYNPLKGTLEIIGWNKKDGTPQAALTLRVGKSHPEDKGTTSWRDTIYGLGWVPLGGYCDIAGMVDETKGADKLEAVPQPWEFRSKAAWKRLCVMVAGVIFNFLLAIGIYIGIAFHWGEDVIPFSNMTEGMDFSPAMQEAGFRDGDILLKLDGKEIDATSISVLWDLMQDGARVTVKRAGEEVDVTVPAQTILRISNEGQSGIMPMSMRIPVMVAATQPGEGAAEAGLEPGDRILAVNGESTPSMSEFSPTLLRFKDTTQPMLIRHADGTEESKDVAINSNGKVGIQLVNPVEIFEHQRIHYSFLESIPRGWQLGVDQLVTYVKSLKLIFTKEGASSVGGFGTLGQLFPSMWNWYSFWQITAFLSIILAFMNIIPIPGLDGGHTLFLLAEMVTRRKPSEKFLEIVNTCGFFFLLLLLVYANGNDIYRLLIK